MPIVVIAIGLVLLIAAVRGTHKELGALLLSQFVGPGSFSAWVFAFVLLGMIGFIEPLKPLSRGLMGLLLLVLLLRNSQGTDLITTASEQIFGPDTAQTAPLAKQN